MMFPFKNVEDRTVLINADHIVWVEPETPERFTLIHLSTGKPVVVQETVAQIAAATIGI